jgi:two-component system invasion response regulator UvrY
MIAPRLIRILLADDHPVVRDGYRRLLEGTEDLRVVAEAGDADSTYAAHQRHRPDVVVLDLSMPGGGLDALRRIRAWDPQARVLVFSMHDSEIMIRRAREAGALDYLVKHSCADELIDAVRRVANQRLPVDPGRMPDSAVAGETGDDPLRELSPREFQIFQLIAEGHALTEIAATLHISPKTANVHHAHIMQKLSLKNDAQLVRLAFQHQIVR